MVEILQNFMAFSEHINFKDQKREERESVKGSRRAKKIQKGPKGTKKDQRAKKGQKGPKGSKRAKICSTYFLGTPLCNVVSPLQNNVTDQLTL